MQNQSKTVKSSQNRSPTTRVGLKSLKDDFDNTRSTHQPNIHQSMMNTLQNEDTAMKSSFNTPSFMNFEQQIASSENKFSSYESVQKQLESTLNAVLDKDVYFKSNIHSYLTSIIVERIHTRPRLMSQMLELKASHALQNPNLLRELLETEQEFLSLSYNFSLQPTEMLNLVKNSTESDGIRPIIEDFSLKSPNIVNLCDFQVDDLGVKHSYVNESWNYLEELKFYPNSLPKDLTIEGPGPRQSVDSL